MPRTRGYWAYVTVPTEIVLGGCGAPEPGPPAAITIDVPAGQWIMIANPFDGSTYNRASVSGVDTVLTYDPGAGYSSSDALEFGAGAFVYSAAGGTVTLSPLR